MRKISLTGAAAGLILAFAGCSAETSSASADATAIPEGKAIVVYFSHTGENYSVGVITEGNTAKVAKVIAAKTGADIYEIKEAKPYPHSYNECIDVAKKELRDKARPEIAGTLPDLAGYQVVYLGYPNWWGDCPMIVYSFLEKSSVEGKTILPFCTHEGSGLGSTAKNLQKAFPGAKIEQNGLSLRGTTAQKDATATEQAVDKWLKQTGAVK